MSPSPSSAPLNAPALGDTQIRSAIAIFRALFPGNKDLANASDDEIVKKVQAWLAIRSPSLPSLPIPGQRPSIRPMVAMSAPLINPCAMAIGVVVVDCIFMILGFVGLHAANSGEIAEVAAKDVAVEVAKNLPKWQGLISDLRSAESITDKAKAIFKIGSAAYTAGMFRGILASIESSMTWWDWTITGVAAVAQIAALVLTDGAAFIAEVVLNATSVAYVVSDSVKAGQACSSSN
jgi:hypothetical protein